MPDERPYADLTPEAQRQYVDASAAYAGWRQARAQAVAVRGGMYWKRQDPYEYLVRTALDNRQSVIGPRNPDTEAMYDAFAARKTAAAERLQIAKASVARHERRNRVEQVGRAPAIVVRILKELESADLGAYFTVVGTHALYAYEAKAGVRFDDAALATRDVDLLSDSRRSVKFFTTMARQETSMLDLLRRVDKTFVRRDDQLETAQNADGFEVDFLRREPVGNERHPVRLSDDEEDVWVVQARNAGKLLEAPRFEAVVVAANGEMAAMSTIEPRAFVSFKRWLGRQASREPVKRARDAVQARVVTRLADEFFAG